MPKDVARRLAFIKALERLLVAGTAGAFFIAFARTIPEHLKGFTLDLFLRYGLLLWLLAYLFASSVNNDQENAPRNWRDVVFDIGQTIASLFSAVVLGFMAQGVQWGWGAYAVTLGTIFLICVISWLLFRRRATTLFNGLRLSGAVVSGGCFVVLVLIRELTVGMLWLLGATLLVLFVILIVFLYISVDARPNADALVEVKSATQGANFAIFNAAQGANPKPCAQGPTPGTAGLKAGSYTVQIMKAGFKTEEIAITVPVPSRTLQVTAKA
jgi:hypothetical protein